MDRTLKSQYENLSEAFLRLERITCDPTSAGFLLVLLMSDKKTPSIEGRK